jgi:hypothetical protein
MNKINSKKLISFIEDNKLNSLNTLTSELIESGEMETRHSTPETEVELALWDLESKKKVGLKNFKGLKLASRPKNERLKALKDIKVFMQYIGFAGEHAVISGLMFRGVNAMKSFIDEGFDVTAMNEKKLFLIQVKTAFLNKNNIYSFNISANNGAVTYKGKFEAIYIFVLTLDGQKTDFIVLPQSEINKQIKEGNIWYIKSTNRYRAKFYLRKKKVYLGNMKNDVSSFFNNWELFENNKPTKSSRSNKSTTRV